MRWEKEILAVRREGRWKRGRGFGQHLGLQLFFSIWAIGLDRGGCGVGPWVIGTARVCILYTKEGFTFLRERPPLDGAKSPSWCVYRRFEWFEICPRHDPTVYILKVEQSFFLEKNTARIGWGTTTKINRLLKLQIRCFVLVWVRFFVS